MRTDLAVGAVALFVFVNLLCYTNRMPLYHEEPLRAMVAQEMLLSGDYVVPTVYQVPYGKKPPMQNWLIALASAPAGAVSGFSARLVSVLALLATALGLYAYLRARRPDIAFPAYLLALTNFVMLCEYGNKVEPDMLLAAFTLLAAVCYLANPTGPGWIALSALFMGAGILTKGVSPLFFYPAAIAWVATDRAAPRLRRGAWLLAHAVLALVPVLIWIGLYHVHGDLDDLFGVVSSEVAGRAGRPLGEFLLHLFTFPPEVFLALLPWSVVAPFALRRTAHRDATYRFCAWVAVLAFAFFWLLPSGKNRLIMPAFPFLAVVTAAHLDLLKPCPRRVAQAVCILFAAFAAGLAGFLAVKGHLVQPLLLGGAAGVALALLRVRLTWFRLGAASALLTLFIFQHGLYFYRTTYRPDYAAAAEAIAAEMTEDVPVVVDDDRNPKRIGFYLQALRGEPVFSKTLPRPDRYYYVTTTEPERGPDGWRTVLIEDSSPDPE